MLRLSELTDQERERFAAGDWKYAPRALLETKPRPLSPWENWLFLAWKRLSQGRRSGAMGGPGNIPWSDIQNFLDREGINDAVTRETVERVIYRMDSAAQAEVHRMAKVKRA